MERCEEQKKKMEDEAKNKFTESKKLMMSIKKESMFTLIFQNLTRDKRVKKLLRCQVIRMGHNYVLLLISI